MPGGKCEKKNKKNEHNYFIEKIFQNTTVNIILIIIIGLIVCFTHFDEKLSINGDNAGYISLGRSILNGEYSYVHIPNSNAHTKFPFGLPVIVALGELFAPGNFLFTKYIIVFLAIGSGLLFYFISRGFFSKFISFLIALFIVINANIVNYSHQVMTEIPFMFFTLLGFYFFSKRKQKYVFWKDKFLILSLLSFAFSFHFRTAGITVIMAVLGFLFFDALINKDKNKWKIFLLSLIIIVLLLAPWQIRSVLLGGGHSYTTELLCINPYRPDLGQLDFGSFLDRLKTNFNIYIFSEIPLTILTNFKILKNDLSKFVSIIISLFIFGFILIGMVKSYFIKNYRIYTFYSLFYLGVVFIWAPVWSNIRFILPFVPFFILFLFLGIDTIFNFIKEKRKISISKKSIFIILIVILFITNIFGLKLLKKTIRDYPPRWKNYYYCAKWVKMNTEKDVLISCRKASLFYLWSDRMAMRYPKTKNTQKVIDGLIKQGVDYVILEQLGFSDTYRFLYPAMKAHPKYFQSVYHLENPDTYVLKFKKNK
ncbi:MAG: glycosyltransferase family 39 protein [Candidatus Marinimicrobia bacterium]|nr:glycosyltransferase family 39 protein [Candidatus Neomarinimicrobiota bacterium]